MFNEEWELLPTPSLMNELPQLCLSGIAVKEDEYEDKRKQFWADFEKSFEQSDAKETVHDIIERVKTPDKAQPDPRDPQVFSKMFEE